MSNFFFGTKGTFVLDVEDTSSVVEAARGTAVVVVVVVVINSSSAGTAAEEAKGNRSKRRVVGLRLDLAAACSVRCRALRIFF